MVLKSMFSGMNLQIVITAIKSVTSQDIMVFLNMLSFCLPLGVQFHHHQHGHSSNGFTSPLHKTGRQPVPVDGKRKIGIRK